MDNLSCEESNEELIDHNLNCVVNRVKNRVLIGQLYYICYINFNIKILLYISIQCIIINIGTRQELKSLWILTW